MKALALAGALLAGAASAAPSVPPVSGEFVRLFSAYCLKSFPDDAALEGRAARERLMPLSAGQAKVLLRGKPGLGWLISGADGDYEAALQRPPFHTCTIQRQSEQMLDGAPLAAAAKAFVESGGHRLLPPVASSRPLPDGSTSDALVLQETDGNGASINSAYMFITVRHPGGLLADGSFSKGFYDMRFVRQTFDNPI
jgi:hypothetical protein